MLAGLAGVCGVVFFGSAGTASARVDCQGKATPQDKSDPGAGLSYQIKCGSDIRGLSIVTNKRVAGFSSPLTVEDGNGAIAPQSGMMFCDGVVPGPGFGCGVPATTRKPADCGQPFGNPAQNVRPPCPSTVLAGETIKGQLNLTQSPCDYSESDPLQLFLVVSHEPIIETINATTGVFSYQAGVYSSGPFRMKLRGFTEEDCEDSDGGKPKPVTALADPTPPPPINCVGKATAEDPENPGFDLLYEIGCDQPIRGWSVVINRRTDIFGAEIPIISSITREETYESTTMQCEGDLPGFGLACGTPQRNPSSTNCGPTSGNDPGPDVCVVSVGNLVASEFGVSQSPCDDEKGDPRLKAWFTITREPGLYEPDRTGHYSSAPFRMPVKGFTDKACGNDDEKKGGAKGGK